MNRNIFIVINSLERGGAERHLTYVLPLLKQKGWVITVISLSPQVPLASVLERAGVRVLSPCKRFSSYPVWLRKIIGLGASAALLFRLYSHHPSALFHYFLPASYIIGSLMAILARHQGPRIMSRRSLNLYQKRNPLLGWVERRLHKFCHFFLANSKPLVKQLIEEESIPPSKVKLIYNGITPHFSAPRPRSSFTIMIVANLISYKGHRDLIKALGLIKDRLPTLWELWIVGEDTEGLKGELQALCHTLSLSSHIHFLGPRSDIEYLWSICHLGVLASHEEGFSNAILEAMAAGIPLVVTDVGGNSETVISGVTGLVVPPHQPAAMAEAMLKLAEDPSLRQTLGQKGKEHLCTHFTLEACVEDYHSTYKKLLSAKDQSACVE